jgi:hypothetical protein
MEIKANNLSFTDINNINMEMDKLEIYTSPCDWKKYGNQQFIYIENAISDRDIEILEV